MLTVGKTYVATAFCRFSALQVGARIATFIGVYQDQDTRHFIWAYGDRLKKILSDDE